MTVVRGCLPIPLYYALLAFHECLANKDYDYEYDYDYDYDNKANTSFTRKAIVTL
jgi:hypothetical protein